MGEIIQFAIILCCVAVVAVFLNKRLLVLVLSSVFVLLVAMRLNIPSMYLMGTVLLALPVASWFIGWYGAQHLRFSLVAPETAFEGEDIPIRVEVTSAFPAFSVLAQPVCRLPDRLSIVEGSQTSSPIPSGVCQEFTAVAHRRGVYNWDLSEVHITDPLGIFTIKRRFSQNRSLLIYPTGDPVATPAAQGRHRAGWPTNSSVGLRGDEEGFIGTREYRLGDDLRRIHWRSSARHGTLVVAEREAHLQSTVWICVDAPRVPQNDDIALERCVKAAVTIMESCLSRGDAVGLMATGETFIPARASADQRWNILEALARLVGGGDASLDRVALHMDVGPGDTVALVTAKPTASLRDAAQRLRNSGARVHIVHVDTQDDGSDPARHLTRQTAETAVSASTPIATMPVEG